MTLFQFILHFISETKVTIKQQKLKVKDSKKKLTIYNRLSKQLSEKSFGRPQYPRFLKVKRYNSSNKGKKKNDFVQLKGN